MVGLKSLFLRLFILVLWKEIRSADNSTIEPKKVRASWTVGDRNVFRRISIVVEAKPQPKVYGCSYLKDDKPVDEICLKKLQNGDLEPLNVQNTSDISLRYMSSDLFDLITFSVILVSLF